jgi:hypothetical protein
MDIGRWSLEKVSKLTDRYRGFHQFVGDVLETSPGVAAPQRETKFSVQNDVEKILELKKPGRVPKLEAVFKALTPYFEAGFLIENSADAVTAEVMSSLRSMFLFGHSFSPSETDDMPVRLALPSFEKELVVTGRVMPVLKTFELDSFKTLHQASAFAFSPTPGSVIILICNRPHPWQVDLIERTYHSVMEVLK